MSERHPSWQTPWQIIETAPVDEDVLVWVLLPTGGGVTTIGRQEFAPGATKWDDGSYVWRLAPPVRGIEAATGSNVQIDAWASLPKPPPASLLKDALAALTGNGDPEFLQSLEQEWRGK